MVDILLDSDLDLQVDPVTGDFAFGFSDAQHIRLIMLTSPGEWFATPRAGSGISLFIKDEDSSQKILPALQFAIERDGAKVKNIDIVDSKIKIEAEY